MRACAPVRPDLPKGHRPLVMRTRPLVLATAGLLLTGCGASTVRSGSAAVVGGDRIATTELQRVVDRGLSDPQAQQRVGADRSGFQRAVLGRLIQHEVLTRAAATVGATVTGAQVDATTDRIAAQLGGQQGLATQAAKAGIAPSDLRQTLRDVALRDVLGDRLTANVAVPEATLQQAYQQQIAMYDQVRSAHILVATQSAADDLLRTVKAAPGRFAELAARFSTDTGSKDQGGELGFQGRGALEKPFEAAIFGNPPGSFVLARTRFGFHVIHVEERRTTTPAQAAPELRRTALAKERMTAVTDLLRRTAARLGVRVNPRFGSWDPTAFDVVPDRSSDYIRTAVPSQSDPTAPRQ